MSLNLAFKLPFFYGWVIVFAAMLCCFAIGFFESYGVYFDSLVEEFGWSRALASSVFSLYAGVYSISAIIMGRLSDRYGPARVLGLCGLLAGFGFLLSSRIESILSLYIFWGTASFGSGGLVVAPLSDVVRWFREKKGLAIGIAGSGFGTGMLIVAPLSAILISSYGWRTAFMIVGILLLAIVLPASFLMRSKSKPTCSEVGEASVQSRSSPGVFTRSFLMVYFILLLGSIVLTSIFVHIVPLSLDMGMSSVVGAFALGLIGGSSVFGSTGVGAISDRVGRRTTLAACLLAQSGVLLWLAWAHRVWMLYSFAVIFGFSTAGVWTLMVALTGELFGTDTIGANLGILSTTFGVGGVVGPIVLGYIFDISGNYRSGLVLYALIVAIAVFLTFQLKHGPERSLG